MTSRKLTADELETTVRSLIGQRIERITYYDLKVEGTEEAVWDFDDWHDVVMGIELTTDSEVYSASWDNSFSYDYGIEMVPAPMTHYLSNIGEIGGTRAWEVTGHPRWRALLTDPVTGARVLWHDDPRDKTFKVPLAIELSFPSGEAWLIAGRPAAWPPEGTFLLGTDDLIVAFNRELADHLGLAS
jgi:hypothetical protein